MGSIYYECGDCRGTGVYSGMCEGPGHAVVCLGCGGEGMAEFKYKVFTGRKRAKGIKTVSLSRGTFIVTGVGSKGEKVSYKDFLDGKLKYAKQKA